MDLFSYRTTDYRVPVTLPDTVEKAMSSLNIALVELAL